jgi:hypothetical protein
VVGRALLAAHLRPRPQPRLTHPAAGPGGLPGRPPRPAQGRAGGGARSGRVDGVGERASINPDTPAASLSLAPTPPHAPAPAAEAAP